MICQRALTTSLSAHVSALALWGVLAAMPQTALGLPAIRGSASLDAAVVGIANDGTEGPSAAAGERCLNDGAGNFASCASFNTAENGFGIALGDLDGDGDPDAVIASYGRAEQRCLNDGVGNFTNCASFNTSDNSYGIALGDLDGDGDLDVVIANYGQAEQRCLNDGAGNFANCASFNTSDNSYGIALGDLDGDGDLDVVIANGGVEQRCLNDGAGNFADCASFNTSDNSYGIALGDLDGDGDLDVVIANGGVEQRCLNDGAGNFADCASFNTSDNSYGIALGDLDGDGDLDTVITNGDGVGQRCLNDGAGSFTDCASFNTSDPASFGVALGDLDGDGDLDAVVANRYQAERRCTNDGAGNFTNCASFNTDDASFGIALGRLDKDGLVEVSSNFASAGGYTLSNFGLQLTRSSRILVGPSQPAGLVALYSFDAKFCNKGSDELYELRSRTVKITKGNTVRLEDFGPTDAPNFLSAPESREGGIGSELVLPFTGDYSDHFLAPGACVTMTYTLNLFSLSRFEFYIRMYGISAQPDEGLMANSANDLSSSRPTAPQSALKMDLGTLDAATVGVTPPVTTLPGGTAPTPAPTPIALPPGISNLPSRH